MKLSPLLSLIEQEPSYRRLLDGLREAGEHGAVALEEVRPYLLAALQRGLNTPMLVITPRPEGARRLQDQLAVWGADPIPFPQPDSLPYERLASDPSTIQQRIKALYTLSLADGAPLIVSSAPALARNTLSPADLKTATHILSQGMRLDIEKLIAEWVAMGYEWSPMVEVPGDFSRRGGIIDVYSPAGDLPARIELFGDEVASIRTFDPLTQRSLELVEEIAVVPAVEELSPSADGGNIIDHLPANAVLVLDNPDAIARAMKELDAEAEEVRREQLSRGELAADVPAPYLTWERLTPRLQRVRRRLSLRPWQRDGAEPTLPFAPAPDYGGRLDAFLKDISRMVADKRRIIIVSHQARRLSELLGEEDIIAAPLPQLKEPPPDGSVSLVEGSLHKGWALGPTVLLTDAEIFGFTKLRRPARRRPMRQIGSLSELVVGDNVVHIEHGIARFVGTTMMASGDSEREYLILEYAAGDRLYVPSDQVDRIGRYVGSGGAPPSLSRLGTQEWSRARQRVKAAAKELAKELLALYAAREVLPGVAYPTDTTWQQELEASFPYIETPDQAQAVMGIKQDMERARPMDRLVCGDVGYGKTEVAIRATFKAVMDGAQVAVLVPTTVLAQQHFATFIERLAAFPVNIAVLSRFRSEREQDEVIDGLKRGTVDIVIGTHRLLQKDVGFKNLGLVVIDEEQRFGVAHKEHLKRLRREVDVLTLTATPIPRTLYMALSGVRDMSTMETPPEERLPIKTYISEYDEWPIREAILRELDRGGQVFFVHNRVKGIERVADGLSQLVPEAEIAVGHGQMHEDELERVMLEFSQGEIDVLVSTTIIESGLDIPNVNTLIVNDADRLGLAQLYQLRGRVGRGANRAYAYFLYAKGKSLTPQAQRRLQTIFEATELGAGFRIAMRDLEIRGAGNILGAEQSGNIGAVGFDLYCRSLQEAVAALREGIVPAPPQPSPTIDLPLKAHIPEGYISDLDIRLTIYQRLTRLADMGQVDEMAEELEDRFGPLPAAATNLLYAIKVKILAMEAGVESVAVDGRHLVIRMAAGRRVDGTSIEGIPSDGVKVGTSQVRLDIKRLGGGWRKALANTLNQLKPGP